MCASPERYLAKRGQKIISQPIKGTARRDSNPEEDKLIAERLFHDEKERSENVMIVDLSELKPGIYFCKLISGELTLYTKFIKT